jgi:gliding-associated putative ABC transporter substrate-binding component GldG
MKLSSRYPLLIAVVLASLLTVLTHLIPLRWDMTRDSRYTLSSPSIELAEQAQAPLLIEVLLEGSLPAEFRKLRSETRQLLEAYSQANDEISYRFIDPMDEDEDPEVIRRQLEEFGLQAARVDIQESGRVSTELVYPWALAFYEGRTVRIPLLKNQLGSTMEDRVSNSVQNLEYAISDALSKLLKPKSRKVAVLKGNGEMDDAYIADFFSTLREYYYIAPFTLDSVAVDPQGTLDDLSGFDLAVIVKPTEAFSEEEKYVLDQFTLKGGSSLWLVDATYQQTDSLSNRSFVLPRDLNLNDLFFKYGLRINPDLVKDVYAAPIVLASGADREAQFNRYPWFFYPLSSSAANHPVSTNLEGVRFEYASSIDTLPNSLQQTVLLTTSPLSRKVGLPYPIDFDKEIPENLKVVNEGPSATMAYDSGEIPLALLIEGEFSSAYTNRIKPFPLANSSEKGESRMVVISDGDLMSNQLDSNGRPLELGFDRFTGNFYGNKEFLLNTVNYLLDDTGLINIRSKDIALSFMDPQRIAAERTNWQMLNILLPLGLLLFLGGFTQWSRRRLNRR